MENNFAYPPDLPPQDSQVRRYIYRSVRPDALPSHPMRRSTDIPRPFQATAGQICPRPFVVKMRVYLKVN